MVRVGRKIAAWLAAAALLGAWAAARADQPPNIKLLAIARGLQNPVYLTSDGTRRLFIVEQAGDIRLMVDGKVQSEPFLDISDWVNFGGECGMLCMAFHPNFAKNGLFYVDYDAGERKTLHTVISEFHVDPQASQVDPKTERILLEIPQPYPNHKGGQLQFGPEDGCLYIGMGDGGAGGDPQNRAQNPHELLGKVLRIDVNKKSIARPYGIPADNPFVDNPNFRPEIFTWGMRNPWRFCFDRKTHVMWCADVGQDLWEEIDILISGGNYGWNYREGAHDFKMPARLPSGVRLIDPIKDYNHTEGNCIIGGYVYRGRQIPELNGWYLYADYGRQWMAALKYEHGRILGDQHILDAHAMISSFGEDAEGELYVCDYGRGKILKIIADK
jgi:glucose/arabinose dehydrogenase